MNKKLKRHAPNKARERWNIKEEINKDPTTDNGVGASSLEIGTEFFSKSVTLSLLAILQRGSAHMCTWFSASWQRFRYDRKCLFSCIYNPQITLSPTSLFSANFNGNRVKNHPKPWTCPLRAMTLITSARSCDKVSCKTHLSKQWHIRHWSLPFERTAHRKCRPAIGWHNRSGSIYDWYADARKSLFSRMYRVSDAGAIFKPFWCYFPWYRAGRPCLTH